MGEESIIAYIFDWYLFILQFENARDAEDAIRGRDGYNFDGCRLRVLRTTNFLYIFLSGFQCWFLIIVHPGRAGPWG